MKDTIPTRFGMDTAQSKNRLLLVDGDPKSLRVLDVSLKKAGFEVTTATSGREALTLLEASQPDLIISDTDLDEMDGFELCSQIKARPEWAKIPFIFVSGRKSIEDKIRGLELGVDDYLTKPIYIKEIGIRVRTALQRAERERMESRREGRTRFAGDLSDVGVVDLVQTIELNRKSGIIHIVNRDTRRGSIFFRDGKVIDAEVGRLSGANAIYRLFSWSEGQFAVEFKQIRRHDVIDTPMAPLLMEGMRRLDESTRLLDKLPSTSSVLEVDCRALAEELAELPDEVNSVLRLCDGTRTLQEVVEDSDHPDLEALTFINKLFASQIIFAREAPDRGGESEPGERLAHWLSEGGAEDGAAAEDATASSEFAAAQILAPDGEVIPERTPVPTGAAARATRDYVAPALAKDVSVQDAGGAAPAEKPCSRGCRRLGTRGGFLGPRNQTRDPTADTSGAPHQRS
jgi:CheY-like chemotaxis protein